jgi:hypothetical protein
MALRWYAVVVECSDVAAQAAWWREALDWRVAYEAPDRVVPIPATRARSRSGQTLGAARAGARVRRGAGGNQVKLHPHLDLAPHMSQDRDEIQRPLDLGAWRVAVAQSADPPSDTDRSPRQSAL